MYLFPFEKINPGERIVIYGAGLVGNSFWQQIKRTKYCRLIAFADRAYDKYIGMSIPVVAMEDIVGLNYDKIVVAIDQEDLAKIIVNQLKAKAKVSRDAIVLGCGRKYDENEVQRNSIRVPKANYAYQESGISIAFYMKRGMGDCIFARKFIESFITLSSQKCSIDLYVSPETETSISLIMWDMKAIKNVFIGHSLYVAVSRRYDISMEIGLFLQITSYNHKNLYAKDMRMAEIILELEKKITASNLDLQRTSDYYVFIRRCELKGYNCYTGYSYDGIVPIGDWHVNIPLKEEFETVYKDLSLPKKYITIDYAWNEKSVLLPKFWPFTYFQELACLLKKTYPDYSLVQIGVKEAREIDAADRRLIGADMELVKYILQGASLHIDYEGGLVHIATQLGTQCVVLMGPSPCRFYSYDNNINLRAEICNGCMYIDESYTQCYRRMEKPECMRSIKPNRVIEAIKKGWKQK